MGETRVYWLCPGCCMKGMGTGAGVAEAEEACIAAHDDASPSCPDGPITIPLRAADALDNLLDAAIESAAVREMLAQERGEAR